ncbi:hypothetical protein GCM10010211_43090 [Streptomyces albospinus]|uniref:Uncharacterized protein n=1 Tax=Streptomyces albospinus TaxID=285515 RepID=A0ABQ2V9J4_9ACTN|nr:hypothetical protein GCM10010211_43090 [Streptomyces albospinus]
MAVAAPPGARGPAHEREAAAACREIMIDLPMDSSGVATLSDRTGLDVQRPDDAAAVITVPG